MKKLPRQAGQFVIEYILLLTVTIAVFTAVIRQMKSTQVLNKIATEPWRKVAGMAETGTWNTPDEGRAKHPNNFDRFYTPKEY